MPDLLKVVDVYSGATKYLGEVPTQVVRDVSSALHSFHPPHSPVQEEPVLIQNSSERFFTGQKKDPTKPVAVEVDEGWKEPPIKFTTPEKEEESNFTSEVNIDFWFEDQAEDKKADN